MPEPSDLSLLLQSRGDLLAAGWTERRIRTDCRTGVLRVIRRGHYMVQEEWGRLWSEGRHLAHVLAVARDASGGGVFSHQSAAVLHGMPLYRTAPTRVHVTTDSSSGRI